MAASFETSFFHDYPDLRPIFLSNARPTSKTIGFDSYCSVEEVAIPGAVCAAKKIHDVFLDPSRIPADGFERVSREFVRECRQLSALRHTPIVQFLGLCFLPGSRLPALVAEKLATSRHHVLDPEPPPPSKSAIAVGIKCSVLHDVASGVSFLHGQTPPVIHRDLSARTVFLNEGMRAKIADLGMVRIVASLQATTMTSSPSISVYMPPEVVEDGSEYDVTIDVFSFGVLAHFTLSQTFPKPLAATHVDEHGQLLGRTELERRGGYMHEVIGQFQEGHPLVVMIQHCLKNRACDRPTIQQVAQRLEQAGAKAGDGDSDVKKASFSQLLQSKDEQIAQHLHSNKIKKEKIDELKGQLKEQKTQNQSLGEQVQSLKEEVATLKDGTAVLMPSQNTASMATPVQTVQWPLLLNWRKGKKMPTGKVPGVFGGYSGQVHPVVIDGMVYIRSSGYGTITQYNPENGNWSQLPTPPVIDHFGMTSFQDQLVLVSGCVERQPLIARGRAVHPDPRITVWDSGKGRWVHPYPPIPTARYKPAAVGNTS